MKRLYLLLLLSSGACLEFGGSPGVDTDEDAVADEDVPVEGDGGDPAVIDSTDPDAGPCAGLAEGAPCGGGQGLCRERTCDASTDCFVDGQWVAAGATKDGSPCLRCGANRLVWERIPNTCFIDGLCYAEGDAEPITNNSCVTSCVPSLDQTGWSATPEMALCGTNARCRRGNCCAGCFFGNTTCITTPSHTACGGGGFDCVNCAAVYECNMCDCDAVLSFCEAPMRCDATGTQCVSGSLYCCNPDTVSCIEPVGCSADM
jgi:hypothetical protein